MMTDYQKGLMITGFGGLVLTFDIPLLRMGGGDATSAQLTRALAGLAVALLCWIVLSLWKGRIVRLLPRKGGLFVAACYGTSAVSFITAVFMTTTANLVFILTSATIFSALLGWRLLGEKPRPATLITMAVMAGAVLLIVSDGLETGNWLGDFYGLCASVSLALGIVMARKSGEHMGFAPMIGGIVPIVLALITLSFKGGFDAFHLDAPLWTIANGAILIPIAFWCLATGPKYLSGPEVAMFYLLETVLAPVWVWLIFAEVPTTKVLIGGAILISALLLHSIWQLKQSAKSQQLPRQSV